LNVPTKFKIYFGNFYLLFSIIRLTVFLESIYKYIFAREFLLTQPETDDGK